MQERPEPVAGHEDDPRGQEARPASPASSRATSRGRWPRGANTHEAREAQEAARPPTEIAKEIWGQLPAQFRDEMANVMNEHPLPTKDDLIRLYYLSLGKKSSTREE